MEEWKAIPGYEGLYEASTEGRIRALPKKTRLHYRPTQLKLRVKKHFLTRNGYPRISLTRAGKRTHYSVHRLIALSFLERKDGKDYVNHKNGVRHDNRLSNLEWVTPSENVTHGVVRRGISLKVEAVSEDAPFILALLERGLSIKSLQKIFYKDSLESLCP